MWYALDPDYYDIFINRKMLTKRLIEENPTFADLCGLPAKESEAAEIETIGKVEDPLLDPSEKQFSLIINKRKPDPTLNCLKIDIKKKKEMPKRMEVYLIYDSYDKDRTKSIVFDGKIQGEMTNDKFKEVLYSKLYKFLKTINVPIGQIDTGKPRPSKSPKL